MATIRTIDRPTIKTITNSGSSITFRWFPRQGKEIKEARGCFALAEIFVGLRTNRKRETTIDEWNQIISRCVTQRKETGLYKRADTYLGGLSVDSSDVVAQFTSDEARRFDQIKRGLGRGLVFAHGLQSAPADFNFAVIHPAILAWIITGDFTDELPDPSAGAAVWGDYAALLHGTNNNNELMAEAA